METVRLGGVEIVTASRSQLVEAFLSDHDRGTTRPRLVFDANGQALSLAAQDSAYHAALGGADIVHADGGFLVTLSRLAKARIAERSATTDLIHDLARACSRKGLSFYLLGGTEDVNARCVARLKQIYPELIIAGRHHGFFNSIEPVIADVEAAAPAILWLGLGKPREQILALELSDRLSATWIVTCGGCFDFVAGDASRAPRWMQRANLEWLYRLARDPKRLFWRYFTTSPHALWLILKHALRRA